jgi:hypothetical protein
MPHGEVLQTALPYGPVRSSPHGVMWLACEHESSVAVYDDRNITVVMHRSA